MSERTRIRNSPSASQRAARIIAKAAETPTESVPTRLWTAFWFFAAGSVLLGVAQFFGVIIGSTEREFLWSPLLIVTALIPVCVVLGLLMRHRSTFAAGVLVALGATAVGCALIDLQLGSNPGSVARPEFAVPLARPAAGPGAWLLIIGHVRVLAAGLIALWQLGRLSTEAVPVRRRRLVIVALTGGFFAAVGLSMAPFASNNPFLPVSGVLDASGLMLIGGLVLALSIPFVAVLLATASEDDLARGGLVGLGIAVAVVSTPQALAGILVRGLRPEPGPYVALFGALVFVLGALALRDSARPLGKPDDIALPSQRILHQVAGVAGLVAGVIAVIAVPLPQLVVRSGITEPENYASLLLFPAGAFVIALSIAMLRPGWAARVRPAFVVALAAIPFAAAGSLDTTLAAVGVLRADSGPGSWLTGIAVVLAAIAAVLAAIAGGLEREDIDLTELAVNRAAIGPGGVAVVCAVGAFWFPVVTASGYAPPDLWGNVHFASDGLWVALAAIVLSVLLAIRSRSAQASALLLGAAVVVLVRLAEFPFSLSRFPDLAFGPGGWFAVGCLVALIVGAVAIAFGGHQLPNRLGSR